MWKNNNTNFKQIALHFNINNLYKNKTEEFLQTIHQQESPVNVSYQLPTSLSDITPSFFKTK